MGKMTTIMVPAELRDMIKAMADAENKAQWRIVEEGISFKYAEKKTPRIKATLSWAEKISWYLCKTLMSLGEFKAVPTKENYERFESTVIQIADRLKLPHSTVTLLLRLSSSYVNADENIKKQVRKELNATAKMLVVDMLTAEPPTEEDEF